MRAACWGGQQGLSKYPAAGDRLTPEPHGWPWPSLLGNSHLRAAKQAETKFCAQDPLPHGLSANNNAPSQSAVCSLSFPTAPFRAFSCPVFPRPLSCCLFLLLAPHPSTTTTVCWALCRQRWVLPTAGLGAQRARCILHGVPQPVPVYVNFSAGVLFFSFLFYVFIFSPPPFLFSALAAPSSHWGIANSAPFVCCPAAARRGGLGFAWKSGVCLLHMEYLILGAATWLWA